MKKYFKWIIPVICIIVVSSIAGGVLYFQKNHIPNKIEYIHSNTTINIDDPREVVGSQRYVFVGFVEETYDYFMEKDTREFPEIIKNYNDATTECRVKIVKNIKGNLTENITFSFFKDGGISEDRKCIQLHENDLIPEVGKYYIFTGYAHEDGTVTGGGPNGTIELESGITAENLETSKLYQKYVDAFNNQILPSIDSGIPMYVAKEDINYDNGKYNKQLYQKSLNESEN